MNTEQPCKSSDKSLTFTMHMGADLCACLRENGRIDWGAVGPKSDGDHLMDFANSLRLTREHFKAEGPQQLHGLYCAGTEIVCAHTGTSPLAAARARILTGLWNALHDTLLESEGPNAKFNSDWYDVAEVTGAGKMHGAQMPSPTISEMALALRSNVDDILRSSAHADLAGANLESVVASLIARIPTDKP